jgi:pimeloyl-ACP methyl ester carboxylesterase
MADPKNYHRLKEARAGALAKYAPGVTTRQVSWSGGNTEVLEAGDGPPLLLVHGGLGQASDWAPIMGQLSQGFHVYAPDRPGHGLADPFTFSDFPSEIWPHAVTFLDEMVDALGIDRTAIVGNSMGGGWAVQFALGRPERVSHVILAGAPLGAIEKLPPEFFEMRELYRMLQRPVIGALIRHLMSKPSSRERARKAMTFLVAHPERLSNEVLDTGSFNIIRNGWGFAHALKGFRSQQGMPPVLLFGERWSELSVPTTFLWGDIDPFGSPELGRQVCARVPHGKLVVLPDAGHLPWLDEPKLVASEIVNAVTVGSPRR